MGLNDSLKTTLDRDSLIMFLRALQSDYANDPGKWEYGSIGDYINSMASWLEDEGDIRTLGYSGLQRIENQWQFLAVCLLAAKYYE